MGPKNFNNAVDQRKLGTDQIEAMKTSIEQNAQDIANIDGLPSVTSEDEGKALIVNDSGEWEPETITGTLPGVTSEDEGKALVVNGSGEWEPGTISTLPEVTSADEGKTLVVNGSGEWVVSDVYAKDIKSINKTLDNLLNPPATKLFEFDLTTSLVDTVGGTKTAELINCSRDSSGVSITGNNQHIRITDIMSVGRKIKIEFGTCLKSASLSFARVLSIWDQFQLDHRSHCIAYGNGKWGYYEGETLKQSTYVENSNIISNGSMMIDWYSSNKADLYINDIFVATLDPVNFSSAVGISGYQGYYNMVVEKITVYG